MAEDETLGSLFGKAKRWARQEIKNATKIGGDPRDQKVAEEQNEQLGREIESDAKLMRDEAIISALTPQSIKDYQAMTAANKAEQDAKSQAEARAGRVARASASRVELSGYVSGAVEDLAVEAWRTDDGALAVSVECIDPAPMTKGKVSGFCFAIPSFHGDGTYVLDDEDVDSLAYELYLFDDDESDGWGFHPSFGPGVIVVSDGSADVQLVLGGSGNDTIDLHATIVLPLSHGQPI